jgi:phosphohistidine phosphatase
MIRLYIVRHGIAKEPVDHAGPDETRPLTGKGRRRFRRSARAFARLGESIDLLISSPYVRAVQTAEILANALKISEVQISHALTPSQSPEAILLAITGQVHEGQGVALVSHDPLVSRLLAHAADLTPVEGARVIFRKGCIVRVDVGSLPSARPAQAKWWLRPKNRDLRQGVPLARPPAPKGEKKPAPKLKEK